MAGLGRKIFTAGDVLTASDVQSYLMDQTVMNFAGTAARSSAIATPTEGMVTYLADTNAVEVYDGAAYVAVGGASGMTLINATSFSAVSSQSLNNVFTSTYQNYEIRLNITAKSALGAVNLRYRASGADNTTANYNQAALLVRTSNASAGDGAQSQTSILTFGTGNATYGISLIAQVFNPQIAQSTYTTHQFWGGDASTFFIYNGGSIFDATTAFDGFTIYPASGTITGTIYVYGLAK